MNMPSLLSFPSDSMEAEQPEIFPEGVVAGRASLDDTKRDPHHVDMTL